MLCRFTKSTIHTSNQLGSPSLYVGECRHAVKISNGTLDFTVGYAQKHYAFDLGKSEVNPIRDDGLTNAKWMDGERYADPTCQMLEK